MSLNSKVCHHHPPRCFIWEFYGRTVFSANKANGLCSADLEARYHSRQGVCINVAVYRGCISTRHPKQHQVTLSKRHPVKPWVRTPNNSLLQVDFTLSHMLGALLSPKESLKSCTWHLIVGSLPPPSSLSPLGRISSPNTPPGGDDPNPEGSFKSPCALRWSIVHVWEVLRTI